MTGLQFDTNAFMPGHSYKITSDFFNYDVAICRSVNPQELVFLIKKENTVLKNAYDRIIMTPETVGAGHYHFTLLKDISVWLFPDNDIATKDLFRYHDYTTGGTVIIHPDDIISTGY